LLQPDSAIVTVCARCAREGRAQTAPMTRYRLSKMFDVSIQYWRINMKRFVLVNLILLGFISIALAQDYDYIEVANTPSGSFVQIAQFDDFKSLLTEYKIKRPFICKFESEFSPPFIFFYINGVQIRFLLNGYSNLKDYQKGISLGYLNGKDYQDSIILGAPTSEIFYYYKRNHFLSLDDALLAYKSGYIFDPYPFEKIILPLSSSADSISLLKKILQIYPSGYGTPFTIESLYSDGKIVSIDRASIPIAYLKKDSKSIISESQIYYICTLLGVKSFKEYQDEYQSREAGFKSSTDRVIGQQLGYSTGKDYYSAIEYGFKNYSEYELGKRINIFDYTLFGKYKLIIEAIDKIKETKQLSYQNSLIFYFISEIGKGPISLTKLFENLVKFLDEYKSLSRIDKSMQSSAMSIQILESFINSENGLKLGKFDIATGIFNRY